METNSTKLYYTNLQANLTWYRDAREYLNTLTNQGVKITLETVIKATKLFYENKDGEIAFFDTPYNAHTPVLYNIIGLGDLCYEFVTDREEARHLLQAYDEHVVEHITVNIDGWDYVCRPRKEPLGMTVTELLWIEERYGQTPEFLTHTDLFSLHDEDNVKYRELKSDCYRLLVEGYKYKNS